MLKYLKDRINKIDKQKLKERALIVGAVVATVAVTIAVFKAGKNSMDATSDVSSYNSSDIIDGIMLMTLNEEELASLPIHLMDKVISVVDHDFNIVNAIDISFFDICV